MAIRHDSDLLRRSPAAVERHGTPRVTFHVAEVRQRVRVAALGAGAASGVVVVAVSPVDVAFPLAAPAAATAGAVLGWACASPSPHTAAGRAERVLRAVAAAAGVALVARSIVAAVVPGIVFGVVALSQRPRRDDDVVIDLRDRIEAEPDAVIALPLEGLPACRAMKRGIDVAIASTALLLMLPALIVAAIAIRLDSPGGVFFRQVRLGRGGRQFEVVKLRTMTVDNDDSEHLRYVASLIDGGADDVGFFKIAGDRRVTRVGAVLRRFSIDELPQLLNVLRGDMSLVGPRPPLPAEVAMYDVDAWHRLACAPGMTGLWQVSGRSRLSFAEMIRLDREYVDGWTPMLDLVILARTPRAVFAQETA